MARLNKKWVSDWTIRHFSPLVCSWNSWRLAALF